MAHEVPDDDWLLHGAAAPGEVAERYDAWAEEYDADLDAWSYRAPVTVAARVLAQHPSPSSVLDVGCGTGLVGRALRAQGYRGQLTGLDVSGESLRVARRHGGYDTLRTADLLQPLELSDGSVDALACVGVMTYLPEVEQTWREFARVVRPGGLVVVTQREDLWQPRRCEGVVARLEAEGVWTAVDVDGPAPYLPDASGALAGLSAYYVTAQVA